MNHLVKLVTVPLVLVLLALILVLSGQGTVTAFDSHVADDDNNLEILPDEIESSVREDNMRVSTETGAPLFIYRADYTVQPASPEAMAEEYLQQNANFLHLNQPGLTDLQHSFTRQSPSGYTVRYAQYINDVPVYNGEIAVHINNQNTVTFVANAYKSDAQVDSLAPTLSSKEARNIAFEHLDVQGAIRYNETTLYVYYNKSTSQLVYQVRVVPAFPIGDWEVLVNAQSGELIKVLDTTYHGAYKNSVVGSDTSEAITTAKTRRTTAASVLVDGTGNIFNPDPLTTGTAVYGDTGYSDNNDADSPELNAQLVNVTLPDIQFSSGNYTLIGPHAEIVDSESPNYGLFSQATSTFNYNRSDNAFEATNTYYHIDASMRYLNTTLSLNIVPYQYATGVRFDPHGLSGSDNSHYSSGTGEVAFGEGGVDDAEDSDVIHHELGHGLHDWVTNGGLSQVDGLSEGSGDYWAQSYNRSIDSWTPSDPGYNHVFRWDGHNEFWNGRTTDYAAIYPGGLVGQIHTDGQIWATCNMTIWDAIGKSLTDVAFWEGLGMTNGSTNQEDAANAVLQAAIDMGYDISDLTTMRSLYETCGYVMEPIPFPSISLATTPTTVNVCSPDDGVYAIDVAALNGFSGDVDLTAVNNPGTAIFNPATVTPNASSTLTISGAAAGNHTFDIVGTSVLTASIAYTDTVNLNVSASAPTIPSLTAPTDEAPNIPTSPTFSWVATPNTGSYDIDIATDAGFNNIIHSANVATNSYTAAIVLNTSTTYYWRVRASNGCGNSAYSATFNFTTLAAAGDCGPGTTANALYSEDFEGGTDIWTHGGTGDTWTMSTARSNSGSYSYYAENVASVSNQQLESPDITLPSDNFPLSLQFWNWQTIESACFDGAIAEISTDSGSSWTQLESELLTDPYDNVISNSWGNPLGGLNAWCGDPQDWLNSIVDLNTYAGETVRFRFSLGTDSSVSREGWYIDDFKVQSCIADTPTMEYIYLPAILK